MEFVPQPEDAKKFGSIKWLKWHMYKYPYVFIIFSPTPYLIYKTIERFFTYRRGYANGTYVPNVVKNRNLVAIGWAHGEVEDNFTDETTA